MSDFLVERVETLLLAAWHTGARLEDACEQITPEMREALLETIPNARKLLDAIAAAAKVKGQDFMLDETVIATADDFFRDTNLDLRAVRLLWAAVKDEDPPAKAA